MSHQDRDQEYRIEMVRQVLRSPGEPLGPAVRALMEGRFGRDLGRVRLHADARAAASARALGARAYAAGPHVVFAEGAYDPGTRRGLWLLAHELAHVVQQGGGPPASRCRRASPSGPHRPGSSSATRSTNGVGIIWWRSLQRNLPRQPLGGLSSIIRRQWGSGGCYSVLL